MYCTRLWCALLLILVSGSSGCENPVDQWLALVAQRLQCGSILLLRGDEDHNTTYVRLQRRLSERGVFSATANLAHLAARPRALHVMLSATPSDRLHLQQMSEGAGLRGGPWLLLGAPDDLVAALHLPLDSRVLVSRGSPALVTLSEVHRVARDGPLDSYEVARWRPAGGLVWTRQLLYERRSQLHGVPLRVAVKDVPPFTEVEQLGAGGAALRGGFFGHVWLTLERSANFSSRYTATDDTGWAAIPRLVARGQADVGFGDVTMTANKTQMVDFTLPLLTLRYQVYIRQQGWLQLPWAMFVKPFSPSLWGAVLANLLLSAALLAGVHSLGRCYGDTECRPGSPYSLPDSLFVVFSAFCQQGQAETPRAWSVRVVFAVVYFTAVILLASYSAILISFLAVHKESLPFTSLQGLLNDGSYQLGVLANSTEHLFFRDTSDAMMQQLYQRVMAPNVENFPSSDVEAFARVCSSKFAYMIPFEYLSKIRSNISCSIVPLPAKYFQLSLALALPRGSEYRGLLDYNLQVLRHGGLLQKLRDLTWPPGEPPESSFWVSVRLTHVAPLLGVLAVGMILATALLVLERVRARPRRDAKH